VPSPSGRHARSYGSPRPQAPWRQGVPQTPSGGATTTVDVTPGAITLAGQPLQLIVAVAPTPGAMTLAGQSLQLIVAAVVNVSPGAVTLAGQTLGLITTVAPTPGSLQLQGHALALETLMALSGGQIVLSGQSLTLIVAGVGVPIVEATGSARGPEGAAAGAGPDAAPAIVTGSLASGARSPE
jgi:hypothetical protein